MKTPGPYFARRGEVFCGELLVLRVYDKGQTPKARWQFAHRMAEFMNQAYQRGLTTGAKRAQEAQEPRP